MITQKPPMGWNTWNTFGKDINEDLILSTAQAIIDKGLAAVGYNYVVIDDYWLLQERDENGKLVADPAKFPHGIRHLADELHKMGLKFGIYSCAGILTCGGLPSSMDREWIDAQTFAEWDVDFLKYDFCNKPHNRRGDDLYRAMGLALANCGKDILFSACSWGADKTHEWIRSTGADMWRSTGDIFDNWSSIKSLLKTQFPILAYGGKGCFNDMDMLIVGMNGKGNVGLAGCTEAEYRTHFAAWCMLQSPLMIGADITNADETTLALLKNETLLAINQDEKCAQTYSPNTDYENPGDLPILVRPLANGDIAIGIFTLSDSEAYISCSQSDVSLHFHSGKMLELTNCWTNEKTYSINGLISAKLAAHDCIVYRAKIVDQK